jgi:hypothetical protein
MKSAPPPAPSPIFPRSRGKNHLSPLRGERSSEARVRGPLRDSEPNFSPHAGRRSRTPAGMLVTFSLTLVLNSVTRTQIALVDGGRRRPLIGGADAVLRRGGRPPWRRPWWSAGRRRAPEAGGSRKRIVLWRAPRPKRERVATSVRVAWPTTLAPLGAPSPLLGRRFLNLRPELGRRRAARCGRTPDCDAASARGLRLDVKPYCGAPNRRAFRLSPASLLA